MNEHEELHKYYMHVIRIWFTNLITLGKIATMASAERTHTHNEQFTESDSIVRFG